MKNNYGHVSILFIREIIINSSEIEEKYKECYSKLPEIANITSGRLKELYACILTSGYILEKVFVKIGINVADPLSIVSNYFEENVLNGVAEPDHVKMLRIAYDLYIANKAHFEDEEGSQDIYDNEKKELMEKYGWVKSVNGEVTINFRPEALKRHITHTWNSKDGPNRYESASNIWRDLKILNVRKRKNPDTKKSEILKTRQIRTNNGEKVSVIQIPLNNFYRYLKLEDCVDDNNEGNIDADDDTLNYNGVIDDTLLKAPSVNADVSSTPCSLFEQAMNATGNYETDNDIIESSDDKEIYELMRKEGLI